MDTCIPADLCRCNTAELLQEGATAQGNHISQLNRVQRRCRNHVRDFVYHLTGFHRNTHR